LLEHNLFKQKGKVITREIPGSELVQFDLCYSIHEKLFPHDLPLQVVGTKLNIGWVETETGRQASLRHQLKTFSTDKTTARSRQKLCEGDRKFDQQKRFFCAQNGEPKSTEPKGAGGNPSESLNTECNKKDFRRLKFREKDTSELSEVF
jgi:hypothetical protein